MFKHEYNKLLKETSRIHTYIIPSPETLSVANARFSVVLLQWRLKQNDIKLALQILQIKVLWVSLEVPEHIQSRGCKYSHLFSKSYSLQCKD